MIPDVVRFTSKARKNYNGTGFIQINPAHDITAID
jgi:hypothetical protein